jgi:hypothetical protein
MLWIMFSLFITIILAFVSFVFTFLVTVNFNDAFYNLQAGLLTFPLVLIITYFIGSDYDI